MKVSRLSFPINSPTSKPENANRVYLDMIDGVLNTVTTLGAVPVGDVPVDLNSTHLGDVTAAGTALVSAADVAAQKVLLEVPSQYLNVVADATLNYDVVQASNNAFVLKSNADAQTITIIEDALLEVGTNLEIVNVGPGELTIGRENGNITIVGEPVVAAGDTVKLVYTELNTWRILQYVTAV